MAHLEKVYDGGIDMSKTKAAGYVRVSTAEQVEGESLTTQRDKIKKFAEGADLELTRIYADEGISGGSMKERHALAQCLTDGQRGQFSVLIVYRLSRFGRNARELLENYNQLKEAGIQLRSIAEGIDFSTKYGEAMLGLLAVIAQLEKDILKEQMFENRVARAKRGVPTSGKLPYGRTYDRATDKWVLDEDKANLIRKAAEDYLSGTPLKDIAARIGMTDNNLRDILRNRCGDTWTVNFKGTEPITYNIDRILTDDTIEEIKERLEFNRKNNRTDLPGIYVLSGFIRCYDCLSKLSGVTLNYSTSPLRAYRHKTGKCKSFKYIPADGIEKAVFETIFENIIDVPSFEKAIKESMPDQTWIDELKEKITRNEKRLAKVELALDDLVTALLNKTLTAETIKNREAKLLEEKRTISEELETDRQTLKSLPNPEEVKAEANTIRRNLLQQYGGQKRLKKLTFDEKRNLLHWLFDGKDRDGKPYGIYVTSKGLRKNRSVDYFLYGKITGLRTLKNDNINHIDDDTIYETNKLTGHKVGRLHIITLKVNRQGLKNV